MSRESALLTRPQMMPMLQIPAPHLENHCPGALPGLAKGFQSPRLAGASIEGIHFPLGQQTFEGGKDHWDILEILETEARTLCALRTAPHPVATMKLSCMRLHVFTINSSPPLCRL